PLHKVTIIPRGNYGGVTMALPEKDRMNYSKKWCIAFMKVCFAGRIAEEMFCGDVNTGAFSDIRQATGLARRMVREWGMNDRLGFVYYGEDDGKMNYFDIGGGREYSEETAKAIDEEIKKLIDTLYDDTRKLLEANRDRRNLRCRHPLLAPMEERPRQRQHQRRRPRRRADRHAALRRREDHAQVRIPLCQEAPRQHERQHRRAHESDNHHCDHPQLP